MKLIKKEMYYLGFSFPWEVQARIHYTERENDDSALLLEKPFIGSPFPFYF